MAVASVNGNQYPPRTYNCDIHEDRMDIIDKELSKQAGWLKAAAAMMTVAMFILGTLSNVILSKLTSIETMLNGNQVKLAELNERVNNNERDIIEIKTRHNSQDQANRERPRK